MIFRIDNTSDTLCGELLRLRKAKKSPIFFRKPDFIAPNVPGPHDKPCCLGGQIYTLFAFAQGGFASLQLPRELRRMKHIVAEFIVHRRNDSRICKTEEKRNIDDSPDHEGHMPCQNRAENHAATDN